MELLYAADRQLFLIINHLPHSLYADIIASVFSGVGTAGMIWFAIAIVLFFREEKQNHRFFLPVICAGVASFVLSEYILKPLVSRARPTVEMGANIAGPLLSDYSFPSGHATIAFAAATVLSRIEPRWTIFLYVLALLISFSRIYLGVHYPLDVVSGAILGWGIGRISLRLK